MKTLPTAHSPLTFWESLVSLEASLLARPDTAALAKPVTELLERFPQVLQGHLDGRRAIIQAHPRVAIADLDLDTAIPCGLIINELVSNSLKYAFPDNRRGATRIRLQAAANDLYRLEVGDNGVGFPPKLDFRNTASLGLQLVMTFVEQLDGSIERIPCSGTMFVVTFPAVKKAAAERAHGESNSASQDENLVS